MIKPFRRRGRADFSDTPLWDAVSARGPAEAAVQIAHSAGRIVDYGKVLSRMREMYETEVARGNWPTMDDLAARAVRELGAGAPHHTFSVADFQQQSARRMQQPPRVMQQSAGAMQQTAGRFTPAQIFTMVAPKDRMVTFRRTYQQVIKDAAERAGISPSQAFSIAYAAIKTTKPATSAAAVQIINDSIQAAKPATAVRTSPMSTTTKKKDAKAESSGKSSSKSSGKKLTPTQRKVGMKPPGVACVSKSGRKISQATVVTAQVKLLKAIPGETFSTLIHRLNAERLSGHARKTVVAAIVDEMKSKHAEQFAGMSNVLKGFISGEVKAKGSSSKGKGSSSKGKGKVAAAPAATVTAPKVSKAKKENAVAAAAHTAKTPSAAATSIIKRIEAGKAVSSGKSMKWGEWIKKYSGDVKAAIGSRKLNFLVAGRLAHAAFDKAASKKSEAIKEAIDAAAKAGVFKDGTKVTTVAAKPPHTATAVAQVTTAAKPASSGSKKTPAKTGGKKAGTTTAGRRTAGSHTFGISGQVTLSEKR